MIIRDKTYEEIVELLQNSTNAKKSTIDLVAKFLLENQSKKDFRISKMLTLTNVGVFVDVKEWLESEQPHVALNLEKFTYQDVKEGKLVGKPKNILSAKEQKIHNVFTENVEKYRELKKQEQEIKVQIIKILLDTEKIDEARVSYTHSVPHGKNKWRTATFSSNAKIDGIWATIKHYNKEYRKRVFDIIDYVSDRKTHEI